MWERYLSDRVGLPDDHLHETAMMLEHLTSPAMQSRLAEESSGQKTDPHGRAIPGNDDALRSIRLFLNRIADAIISGRGVREAIETAKNGEQAATVVAASPPAAAATETPSPASA